jgi:hypothetical protein
MFKTWHRLCSICSRHMHNLRWQSKMHIYLLHMVQELCALLHNEGPATLFNYQEEVSRCSRCVSDKQVTAGDVRHFSYIAPTTRLANSKLPMYSNCIPTDRHTEPDSPKLLPKSTLCACLIACIQGKQTGNYSVASLHCKGGAPS